MLLLDPAIAASARQRTLRRVFFAYVLAPPAEDVKNLGDYVNLAAASGRRDEFDPRIAKALERAETALSAIKSQDWRGRWFKGEDEAMPASGRYAVIVASPRYEDEGWGALLDHRRRFPDIHFELHTPYDLAGAFYAVVAGRGLAGDEADELVALVKQRGMAADSFRWAPSSATHGPNQSD